MAVLGGVHQAGLTTTGAVVFVCDTIPRLQLSEQIVQNILLSLPACLVEMRHAITVHVPPTEPPPSGQYLHNLQIPHINSDEHCRPQRAKTIASAKPSLLDICCYRIDIRLGDRIFKLRKHVILCTSAEENRQGIRTSFL
jgi:hypothetical protein